MMDPARAAPVLNLDAKPQVKSAGDGNKGEAGESKVKFQDTLNRHVPSKGQQGLQGGDQDQDALAAAVDGSTLLDADDAGPERTVTSSPVSRFQKPIILLAGVMHSAQKAGTDDGAETPVKDRLDLRTMGKARDKTKSRDVAEADSDMGSDLEAGLDALAGLQAADDKAVPAPTKSGRRDMHAAEDADTLPATEDKAAPKMEPVRDVLSLLHGTQEPIRDANRTQDVGSAPDLAAETVEAAPGADQGKSVYRLSRADGKGGALDIPGNEHPSIADKHVPDVTVNAVTVVDQRRYLAPAQDNALAVINAIGGNQEWVSATQPESSLANAAAMAGSGKVVNTLKIQMHPIELGLVTATMRLAGEELSVELKVENGNAYRQLKDDQSRIVEALKAQGFSVDQVSVVLAPERPDSGNGQSSTMQNGQGSAFAQQNQARSGAQDQASSGRGQGGYQQETGRNDKPFADDGRTEVGIAGSRGAPGTGQLYL